MICNRYGFLLPILALIGMTHTCEAQERQIDGILFRIEKYKETDPAWVKVQVCTENIIRVVASQEKSMSARPSLMVTKTDWNGVPWSAKDDGNRMSISTSALTVRVNKLDGAVAFYGAQGTVLLQERAGGGKILAPANVLGEKTWHIRQLFDSPADEAFYGLGAHQNGIMNYKNHDVDLWQHNIVDVIPFLVSSRNYGILWDNYSRTKFGDIRDYRPLNALILVDRNGRQDGLTVDYYRDRNCASLLTSATDSTIAHDFVDRPGVYPPGFDINNGSIRWSGEIGVREAGIHKFRLYSSGYVKMWLNGDLVVDAWRQNWLPWTHMVRLAMEPGKRYPLKIEWIPDGGSIGLTCLPPEDPVDRASLSLFSEVADQIDYYFISGSNADEIIRGYRTITGEAPMMPEWALGYWQSRQRYTSQDELLSVVKEFRRRNFPIDNIVQDWFYWKEDQWGSHEFDPTRFPDPAGMVKTLHEDLHTRIMISVWPKFYVGTKHYDEFRDKGWLYMHNIEKGVRDWVGPGYVSTFFDPFSSDARDLYWKQINDKLFSKGFDAWWLDSTEPDLQSNVSDSERIIRMHPNALGSAARYENAYSLMVTRAVYENQRRTNPDQRVFILTRSAYAGQQRNAAATWSGDLAGRWSDLQNQIPAGLNFSLSGIPYWTSDIGGFALEQRFVNPGDADRDEWRELITRWFQFGTFCPLLRSHGEGVFREPFNIAPADHPAYESMLSYTRMRYRLMPYMYSLAAMVTRNDYTIMRALVMDFGDDAKVRNIGNEFMFGPALLVNPVTEYRARARTVYLPAGTSWYELKSGKRHEGGNTIQADAPYTDIPVFVRGGSILPCGPEIQYTDEKPADPIRLFVYTGADGSFTLYEDENVNYNCERGLFSIIPLTYSEKEKTLTIGQRAGEFPGMLHTRTFEIVWITPQKPSGLDFSSKPDARVTYDGHQQLLRMR